MQTDNYSSTDLPVENRLLSQQGINLPAGFIEKEAVQYDTGLGTTYERWALNRLLLNMQARLGFNTLFEGPGDGMTGISGINSLILGQQGVEVTSLLPDPARAAFASQVWDFHAPQAHLTIQEAWDGQRLPFQDGEFEFVWNFNVMTCVKDFPMLVRELTRISSRYLFISVPNRSNYAFWLHRLHHRVAKDPWDHGRISWMHPTPWVRLFSEMGMNVEEVHWFDCPWWPDIVDPGQMIKDFLPFMKKLAAAARPENRLRWSYRELPYFCPAKHQDLHRRMEKLAFVEDSRILPLKRRFAHHFGVLASKEYN
jgi:hypothetical protein